MKLTRPSPLLLAALVMAASGFIVIIVATRVLPEAERVDFLVYWSALYGVTGALAGVQNESSRALASTPSRNGGRVVALALAVGLALGLGTAVTGIGWLPALTRPDGLGLALLLIAVAVTGYAGHNAAVGGFLGLGDSAGAAILIVAEAVTRLALFGIVALIGWGLAGFWAATALPMALWVLVLLLNGRLGRVWALRADEPTNRYLRNVALAVLAGACTSVLVNGYPAVLRATVSGEGVQGLDAVILAISLTRAPLLVPIISFQGAIVAFFVRQHAGLVSALLKAMAVVWALTTVVALGMGRLGPWVMGLLYPSVQPLTGIFMGLLAVGAGSIGSLVVATSVALARGRHGLFLAAWILATAASIAMLFLPLDVQSNVIISLAVGPVVGVVVALTALAGRVRLDPPH